MFQRYLDFLRCPYLTVSRAGDACGGALDIAETGTPIEPSVTPDGDITEALLRCRSCGNVFPVILGVLILVPDVEAYLFDEYYYLCKAITEAGSYGGHVSPQMSAHLSRMAERSGTSPHAGDWDMDVPWILSAYVQANFGTLGDLAGVDRLWQSEDAWQKLIAAYAREALTPYSWAERVLADRSPPRTQRLDATIGLDIGCAVGGMAYRLAPLCDLVLGVDLSFTTVLTARRIVLHAPVALDRYRVQLEEGIWSAPLPLQIQVQSNVDFLVASVSSLPFASGMAACATAMNVVDTLPDPRALFREVSRALAADGAFVLSSPYAWAGSLASAARKEGGGTSEGFVDQALRDHALVPERSEPALPWLLRYHSRYWNLYLCHCVESVRESR